MFLHISQRFVRALLDLLRTHKKIPNSVAATRLTTRPVLPTYVNVTNINMRV